MTVRRKEIEHSLAIRGRPAVWANEQEAAVLSGVGGVAFKQKVQAWEKLGFPKVNPENGKRSIPAILAFWNIPQNHFNDSSALEIPLVDDADGEENWSAA